MLFIQALLRGAIPLIIMGGIALSLYFQANYSDAKGTFTAGLITFFVGATTVIYNIDHWGFTKQSGIHFLIMLITVYPILLFSGWFTIASVFDAFKIFLLFLAVGAVLWLVLSTLAKFYSR
ncbi:DUF3021 family protein [Lentibacillus salicampi]|nr:DUF3021 family protein [Lentibacillus salicampi]